MKSKTSPEGKEPAPGSTSGSGLVIEVEPGSPHAVGRRIQELRGAKTRDVFAAELEVHPNTLARYEGGKRMPETDFVMTVCMRCHVNPAWLLFGTEPKWLHSVTEQPVPEYARLDLSKASAEEVLAHFMLVPLYDVRAAAGFGALVEDRDPVEYWAFRRDWLEREVRVPQKRLALIYVAGNSMEPDLHDGDVALVDRGDVEVLREGVYVFSLEGHVFVKQVRLDGTRLVIESRNKEHATIELNTLREDLSFRIAARVLGTPCFHKI